MRYLFRRGCITIIHRRQYLAVPTVIAPIRKTPFSSFFNEEHKTRDQIKALKPSPNEKLILSYTYYLLVLNHFPDFLALMGAVETYVCISLNEFE